MCSISEKLIGKSTHIGLKHCSHLVVIFMFIIRLIFKSVCGLIFTCIIGLMCMSMIGLVFMSIDAWIEFLSCTQIDTKTNTSVKK